MVSEVKTKSRLLKAIETYVPVGGAVLGLALVGFGLYTRRRDTRADARRSERNVLVSR
jgi:hypothetical protein